MVFYKHILKLNNLPKTSKYIYNPDIYITDLNKSLTFSDTNNINGRLQDIYKIQSLKLREKRRKKIFRDGAIRIICHFWGNDKVEKKIFKAQRN
jgi:hypothetical protein